LTRLALPNERIFGAEIGAFYRDVHAQHGVEIVLGEDVEALAGKAQSQRCKPAAGARSAATSSLLASAFTPRRARS
jgi:hypothetical protein